MMNNLDFNDDQFTVVNKYSMNIEPNQRKVIMSDYDKTIDYLIKRALKASRKAGKKALRPGKFDHSQKEHFNQAEQLINIARKLEELKDVQ